ncbi:MAG: hypothetical protein Hyperionvirus11_16 [Hyperionvirus sp.]|uniref:Uncharacterized protein n=1 Tax=Hyperionvirus sp. TaxID=2487770 RepID=A0A3G5ACY0_9VIRU|nr:MAG: hypothetical protein Hyperionvirus11_16 [Hyperionvirus sp.]
MWSAFISDGLEKELGQSFEFYRNVLLLVHMNVQNLKLPCDIL